MPGIYFDDYQVGQTFETPTRTLTETDVVYFSAMSGDMNELHTSEEFAQSSPFGRRIAQGLLGLSVSHGLMFRLGLFDGTGIALLNIDKWKFTAPIFFGDTVHCSVMVHEKIESKSKPDRGIIHFLVQVINQKQIVTQEGIQTIMVKRKT
ncbi:MaoC/PaaZ C-terminal domain-containing protein [Paenibacillus cremeus]|uniref:Dehydratase n=1 Tax=Paenibacillus cremeus TaxID=2163881 RepID=A0A559JRA9_9BACL|nr:MaoC/PaaZ C-terminal domain-containing protein [Paenibacillus cremeus]TVY02419.1 dehydratase [Paenibacillus cremeus]